MSNERNRDPLIVEVPDPLAFLDEMTPDQQTAWFQQNSRRLHERIKRARQPVPFSEEMLTSMRVEWFIDPHYGSGHVEAIYADGTCDVRSDNGPLLTGLHTAYLRPPMRRR